VPDRPGESVFRQADEPLRASLCRQLGEVLADLHAVEVPGTRYGGWDRGTASLGEADDWRDYTAERAEAALARATRLGVLSPKRVQPTREWLAAHLHVVPRRPPRHLLHYDLSFSNVLVDARNRISTVLDFEWSGIGPPASELGAMDASDGFVADAFWDGYLRGREPDSWYAGDDTRRRMGQEGGTHRTQAMLVTKTRCTFADLLEQSPGEETIYDILGGDLVVWSSPSETHAVVVTDLMDLLLEARRAGYGEARTAPRAVAFDYAERGLQAQDVTHPDVFFVRASRRAIMGQGCVEAAPDLVVEVLSPTTRADDLPGGRKFAIYERYAVPYYWIVDPDARTVAQYEWHDGRYGPPVVLQPGDTLSCPLFPTVIRDVAALFAGIN
jgi:Uma2 family endonuclease